MTIRRFRWPSIHFGLIVECLLSGLNEAFLAIRNKSQNFALDF